MSDEQELKACPFCGNDNLDFATVGNTLNSQVIICYECGAIGLETHRNQSKDQAIKAWNTLPSEGGEG